MRIRARGRGGWRRLIRAGHVALVEGRRETGWSVRRGSARTLFPARDSPEVGSVVARPGALFSGRYSRKTGPFVMAGASAPKAPVLGSPQSRAACVWSYGHIRAGGRGPATPSLLANHHRRRAVAHLASTARRCSRTGRARRERPQQHFRGTAAAVEESSPNGWPPAIDSSALHWAVPSNQEPWQHDPKRDPHNNRLQLTCYVGRPFGASSSHAAEA